MSNIISLHDYYVTGLIYDRDNKNLYIQTETSDGNKVLLQYASVAGWDLSPFDEQNILFDVHEYDGNNLPDWIIQDFEVPQQYIDLIREGKKKLYYLEPSIGLGGYVIASIQIHAKQNLLK
jgi:uncharacterized Rmd1/YagE family protein